MEYVEVLKDVEVLKYQLAGLFDTLQQAETKNHDIDHTMNKLKDRFHLFSPKFLWFLTLFFWKINHEPLCEPRKRQKTNDSSQKTRD